MTYASTTTVSTDRSKAEIEKTLVRYGADSFLYGFEGDLVIVGFRMMGRMIRFRLPVPGVEEFRQSPAGRRRTQKAAEEAQAQATRARWRALLLIIKAKLEAIETGVTTFEYEFMAHTMLPSGQTVGDFMAPQIAQVYENGQMPSFLPGVDPGRLLGSGE